MNLAALLAFAILSPPPIALTTPSGGPAEHRPIRVGDVLVHELPRPDPRGFRPGAAGACWQVVLAHPEAFTVLDGEPALADAYGRSRGARLVLRADKPGSYRVDARLVYFAGGQWNRGGVRTVFFEVQPPTS